MANTSFHTTFSTNHFSLSHAKNGSESGLRSAVLYRFGFNGQEMDNEISGQTGTHTTAMFWEYDTRLGRRWNLDPVVKDWESPYLCFGGNPICNVDANGNDWDPNWAENFENENQAKIIVANAEQIYFSCRIYHNAVDRLSHSENTYTISPGYDVNKGGVNGYNEKRNYEAKNQNTGGKYIHDSKEIVLHIFNGGYNSKSTIFEEVFHAAQDDYYSSTGEKRLMIQTEVEAKMARTISGYGREEYEKQFEIGAGDLMRKYLSGEKLTDEENSTLTSYVQAFAFAVLDAGYEEKSTQEDWDYISDMSLDETFKYLKNDASK